MELQARTLREVEFREKLRGYHQDDVDEFLEKVATGIEVLQERLRQATERSQRAEQRLTELPQDEDDSLRRTLVLAQRTADMAVKEAQDRASEMLTNAQAEARAMIAEAEEAARRVRTDAEQEARTKLGKLEETRAKLQTEVDALERHIENERTRVISSLSSALKWLEENVPSVTPPPVFRDMTTQAGSMSSPRLEGDRPRADRQSNVSSGSPASAGVGSRGRTFPGDSDAGPPTVSIFDAEGESRSNSEGRPGPTAYRA